MQKRWSLFVWLLASFWVCAGVAQPVQVTETASTNIKIVSAIQITVLNNVDFGTLALDASSVTLNPKTGAVTAGNGAVSVGRVRIEGEAAQGVIISYQAVALPNQTATFTPSVIGAQGVKGQSNATALASGTAVTLNRNGRYHVWVGGDLNVASASTGAFSGRVTITAAYNF